MKDFNMTAVFALCFLALLTCLCLYHSCLFHCLIVGDFQVTNRPADSLRWSLLVCHVKEEFSRQAFLSTLSRYHEKQQSSNVNTTSLAYEQEYLQNCLYMRSSDWPYMCKKNFWAQNNRLKMQKIKFCLFFLKHAATCLKTGFTNCCPFHSWIWYNIFLKKGLSTILTLSFLIAEVSGSAN